MSLTAVRRGLAYLWAAPNTLFGLLACMAGALGGASATVRDGVLEVHGPGVKRLLAILPVRFTVLAITCGHVVLGADRNALSRTRSHERAHVEQSQRLGPAFLPAYLLASLYAWLRGGDAYRDNYFERQARAAERREAP